jgi:excisionase family DNA binding protein
VHQLTARQAVTGVLAPGLFRGTGPAIQKARGRVQVHHIERAVSPNSFEPRFNRSVSLEQAAGILQVSRRTIYNWIRAGRLQTIRTLGGRSQRVLLASLQDLQTSPPVGDAVSAAGDSASCE